MSSILIFYKENQNKFIKPTNHALVKDLCGCGQKLGLAFVEGGKSYPCKAPHPCIKFKYIPHQRLHMKLGP